MIPSKKTALLLLSLGLAWPLSSKAFVFSKTTTGLSLRWPAPVRPVFYANWNNDNFLSYSQVFQSLTNSLQRWKGTGGANIDFDYFQGGSFPAITANDGKNAIFFSSQSTQKMGSSTIGVTSVYSYGNRIVEADIEFNDEEFQFTTNPTDSSQFGAGYKVFLENVATHEFGHAYGLNHSAVLQSSMVFLEDRGQSKPSCDDIQAIAEAYPLTAFTGARGSISGSVVSTASASMFGAHVLAISKTRGSVVSAAITDKNGSYAIPNLEPGVYYLMVEPFQMSAPITSLCGGSASDCYYGTVNSSTICPGFAPFKRGFIESSAGMPTPFAVSAGSVTTAGTYMISCSAMGDPWGAPLLASGTAPTVLSANLAGEASTSIRAVMGSVGTSHYFKLSGVQGTISAKVLSYGLYSSFDPSVTILGNDAVTAAPGVAARDNAFSNSSNFINFDSTATLRNAPLDTYYVRVSNVGNLALSTDQYPAGAVGSLGSNPQIDNIKYYLLILTINDSTVLVPSSANPTLADNLRCEAADSFSAFPDHGPIANSPPPASEGSNGGGAGNIADAAGCGVVKDHRSFDSNALFSIWSLVFFLIAGRFIQRLARY